MIKARVDFISQKDDVALVEFSSKLGKISMISLELDERLGLGSDVVLDFKSTDLLLFLNKPKVLVKNVFCGKVIDVLKGDIINVATLKCGEVTIEAIFSSRESLEKDMEIWACVSEMSVFVSEILC